MLHLVEEDVRNGLDLVGFQLAGLEQLQEVAVEEEEGLDDIRDEIVDLVPGKDVLVQQPAAVALLEEGQVGTVLLLQVNQFCK